MFHILNLVDGTNATRLVIHNKNAAQIAISHGAQARIHISQNILPNYEVGFWGVHHSNVVLHHNVLIHLHMETRQNSEVMIHLIANLLESHTCRDHLLANFWC